MQTALAEARAAGPVGGAVPLAGSAWAEARPLVEAPAPVEASTRADLTGDGRDMLLRACSDGRLLALTVEGAPVFGTALGTTPSPATASGGLLVTDLDDDGTPEVVSGNETGFLVAYSLTGQRLRGRVTGAPVTDILNGAPIILGGLIVSGDDPSRLVLDGGRRRASPASRGPGPRSTGSRRSMQGGLWAVRPR